MTLAIPIENRTASLEVPGMIKTTTSPLTRRNLILLLGALGGLAASSYVGFFCLNAAPAKPPKVAVIDTTGAGDAFTAALMVALVGGMDSQTTLEYACLVSALTTTLGVQSSPTSADIEAFKG